MDTVAASLIALGVGTAVYRWVGRGKELTRQAREDLRRRQSRGEMNFLRQASRMPDPRFSRVARRMKDAFARLQQIDRWRCEDDSGRVQALVEINDQACQLYLGCRNMLLRSLDLFHASTQMATQESRVRMMQVRDEVSRELEASLNRLDQALDQIYAARVSGTSRSISSLASLRDELDQQLKVARRVEERMEDLGKDWTAAHRNPEDGGAD